MAATQKKKRRVKIVFRHSSTLLKCVILAAIVLSTAAILILRSEIGRTKQEYDDLRGQAAQQEQKKLRLEDYIKEHGTVEGIKRYAGEVLGLVDPDTTFYDPETESN